ncbi:hypothetical protein [Yoonia sp. BS5-3]|uniref:Type II secretion system protein GspF domain-containing protein n=1 Tax=Yoonia phaeophyticola TaxID=3137369 RepID=A0ABZ3IDY5_9RHOB
MIGVRNYWIVAWLGVLICLVGIAHGLLSSSATVANKYGAVAVALTFGMLFLSRGTAFRLLDTPVVFETASTPIAERLEAAISDLSSKRFAEASSVRALVECLVELDTKVEVALVSGERERADEFGSLVKTTIEALPGTKRTAVEANFLARRALHSAQRNREGLAALLDSNRKESVPIAMLSIVATLCAGLGDAVVGAIQWMFT